MRYSAVAKAGSPGLGVSLAASASAASTAGGRVRPRACMAGRRRASTARASASVVGSGTVGPEPMVAGSSPGTSEMASVSMGATVALRSRPPLMRETWRRTVFISWMSAPHLSSPRDSPVLSASVRPAAGAAHKRGGAARQQHQHEIALRGRRHQRQRALGGALAGVVGRRMSRRDDLDHARAGACQRLGRAVRGRREAGDAVEGAELAIVRLGGDGHGSSGLAGSYNI